MLQISAMHVFNPLSTSFDGDCSCVPNKTAFLGRTKQVLLVFKVFLEDGTEVDEESFKYMQENFGGYLGCTFILGSSAFTSDPFNAG
ncbi:hypothetical protein V5799_000589 [Amblyomma americanum]|uniref:Uncharacterized protein n=1 Tax=Amblyomma americanum TaxID=6943 RepID=A0AAQ4D2L3_AMBAM